MAPPHGREWEIIWHSDAVKYGGCGAAELTVDGEWILPAEATIALRAVLRT
jgi:hypothetical protein